MYVIHLLGVSYNISDLCFMYPAQLFYWLAPLAPYDMVKYEKKETWEEMSELPAFSNVTYVEHTCRWHVEPL